MTYIDREVAMQEFATAGALFVYGEKVCKAIIKRLRLIPAADVREVVTCADCRFCLDVGFAYCIMWADNCPSNPEFYCAYGERRQRGNAR